MSGEHLAIGNTYHNIQISGNARVLLGKSIGHASGSEISARADYVGQYAHSSLRPVANYVSRPRLQQKIKEELHDVPEAAATETRILVVCGLGGFGKSQLVLNYVREYRGDYTAVFWIEAGQKESIERDFPQIHRLLFDQAAAAAGLGPIKLEDASGQSLVVFNSADSIDHADDASYIDLEYFLPDASSVDIIITTRSSRAEQMTTLEAVKVAEMEEQEAVELFRKCVKLRDREASMALEVAKIVKELGYLALAITLAASYVAATPRLSSVLGQYLPEYYRRRKKLLSVKATKHIHRYDESVLSTWETSFSAATRQSPLASRLLSLSTFLNFDDIFLDLFVTNISSIVETESVNNQRWRSFISPQTPSDRYEIESAFTVLQRYSLVQWRNDQETYTMHKLVHAWGRDRLDTDQQQQLNQAALELLAAVVRACRGNLVYEARLVPHVMVNFSVVSTVCVSTNNLDEIGLGHVAIVADFMNGLGRWSDEYQIRLFHFQELYRIAGGTHPDTLESINNLASVLRNQGKYEQAEEIHRQTLRLRETALGKEHPSTLASMNNLALVLSYQGKYEQAEEIHRQTLRLRETALGKEHPSTLTSMNNLASVLRNQGKYEQAEEIHRQTLRLSETALGKEHPSTLGSMYCLAHLLASISQFKEASIIYEETVAGFHRVLGAGHPSTVSCQQQYSSMLKEMRVRHKGR